MLDGVEYNVELKIGRDIPDVKDVKSIISRQLLCEMVARIEDDIYRWKGRDTSVKCGVCGRVEVGMPQVVNHNYLITGVRGSGKTTFLNYVISTLVGELDPFVSSGYKENGKLQSRYTAMHYIETERKNVICKLLCRFDPSSHEVRHGYFLLSVVAAIQSKLADVYSSSKNNGVAFQEHWNRCKSFLNCLDVGIARLSKGRLALSDMTEEQVKQLRTENAELEEQIRSNFANVVELLCQLCCVDAFIISIDDADTRSAQCTDVIEDLRLYVSHPRLIVLFAGDRDLYMERIRGIHFKEYDHDYHKADERGKEARMNYVMGHANQYFIKLFPVENHYELKNLKFLATKRDPIVCHLKANEGFGDDSYDGSLISAVRQLFRVVIGGSERESDVFVDLFLSLPMRSIIQVLNGWSLMEVWKNLYNIITQEAMARQGSLVQDRSTRKQLRNAVKYSLNRVLISEIHYNDYSYGKIDVDNPPSYFSLLLHHCQNMNDAEHGYFLSGDIGESTEERYVSFLLAISSGNMMQGFNGFISYLLYGPASVSLYAKATEQLKSKKREELDFLRSEFNRYIHLSSLGSPTRWARNANMIWGHDSGYEGLHTGVLCLCHTDMVKKLNQRVMQGTFLKTEPDSSLQALAMMSCMSVSVEKENCYYISLWHYIAFILKCFQTCEKSAEKNRERNGSMDVQAGVSAIEADIIELLENLYPIKSCRRPSWLQNDNLRKSYNKERVRLLDRDKCKAASWSAEKIREAESMNCLRGNKDIKDIAFEIAEWYVSTINEEQGENTLSVHTMSDLWANMYYGIKRICHKTEGVAIEEGKSLDDYLRNKNDHISEFYSIVRFFDKYICTKSVNKTLLDYYLNCLHEFPLTKYLLKACGAFATGDSADAADGEGNASSAETPGKGGKGKKNILTDSQPSLPLSVDGNASQKAEQ